MSRFEPSRSAPRPGLRRRRICDQSSQPELYADRYPVGEAVNFAKLPLDFGIIHYASDTPYTQARTLGARGLSYYGMDSTYASSLAILRRVFRLEGILVD